MNLKLGDLASKCNLGIRFKVQMNGYLEVGVLEVDQENEVPFSDRLQHQRDCLNFEFGKGDISVQIRQVEHGMPPPQCLLHQTQPDVVI